MKYSDIIRELFGALDDASTDIHGILKCPTQFEIVTLDRAELYRIQRILWDVLIMSEVMIDRLEEMEEML